MFTSNLESVPGTVFVILVSLDKSGQIGPNFEMFVKRRLKWVSPFDLPQFESLPS